jgi:hypothetical protein
MRVGGSLAAASCHRRILSPRIRGGQPKRAGCLKSPQVGAIPQRSLREFTFSENDGSGNFEWSLLDSSRPTRH